MPDPRAPRASLFLFGFFVALGGDREFAAVLDVVPPAREVKFCRRLELLRGRLRGGFSRKDNFFSGGIRVSRVGNILLTDRSFCDKPFGLWYLIKIFVLTFP